MPISVDHLDPITHSSRPPDQVHFVADDDYGRHRLVRLSPADDGPLAVLLPIDAGIPIRLDAASRVTHSAAPSAMFNPTELQRARLALLLKILDAEAQGLSKREIAWQLVYPTRSPLHGAAWKGSTERRRTHRLCLQAAHLRDCGIGNLLRARLHGPG